MDFAILTLGFTTGLVTSLHCLGMCGSLVIAVGQVGGASSGRGWAARSAGWNLGRGVALVAVAAAIGALGSAVTRTRGAAIVTLVAGILTLAVALAIPGWLPIPRSWRTRIGESSGRLLGRVMGRRGTLGAFVVGLVTVLLPCGPLYGMWAQAAALGPWGGAALAGAFWAGTVPALAALGAGGGLLLPRVRRFAVPLASATLAIAGSMLVWRGIKVLGALSSSPGCCHHS